MILLSPVDIIFFFYIKAGGDLIVHGENKNDLGGKFISTEVVLFSHLN
jgi:hypothetical protein